MLHSQLVRSISASGSDWASDEIILRWEHLWTDEQFEVRPLLSKSSFNFFLCITLLTKAIECGEALRENLGARFFNLSFSCEWICSFIGTHSLVDAEVINIFSILSWGLILDHQEAYALSCRLLGMGFPISRVGRLISNNARVRFEVLPCTFRSRWYCEVKF